MDILNIGLSALFSYFCTDVGLAQIPTPYNKLKGKCAPHLFRFFSNPWGFCIGAAVLIGLLAHRLVHSRVNPFIAWLTYSLLRSAID